MYIRMFPLSRTKKIFFRKFGFREVRHLWNREKCTDLNPRTLITEKTADKTIAGKSPNPVKPNEACGSGNKNLILYNIFLKSYYTFGMNGSILIQETKTSDKHRKET